MKLYAQIERVERSIAQLTLSPSSSHECKKQIEDLENLQRLLLKAAQEAARKEGI